MPCSPSWTWQALSTWPQVTDGYKLYRNTHCGWQRKRNKDREGKVEIWSVQGAVGFGEEKERKWEKWREFFIPAPLSSVAQGLGICQTGQRTGQWKLQKVERRVQRGSDGGGCGNIVSSRIRDGPWKPPVWAKEKREGDREEAEVRVGECVLTKPFERSCYELVVNLCIL